MQENLPNNQETFQIHDAETYGDTISSVIKNEVSIAITNQDEDELMQLAGGILVLKEIKNQPKNSFFVTCTRDNKIIGISCIAITDEDEKVIDTFIFVSKKFRKLGIATQLISQTHINLIEMGIMEYNVHVSDESEKLYISIRSSIGTNNVVSIEETEDRGYQKTLLVKLKK